MIFEIRLLVITSLLLFGAGPALAINAAMKQDQVACRDIAAAKKHAELQRSNSNALRSFTQERIAAGECQVFRRKSSIAIDMRREAFSCVRAEGGLDCLWAANGSIEEHPGYKAEAAKIPASAMPMFRSPGRGPVLGAPNETVEHGFRLRSAGDGSRN